MNLPNMRRILSATVTGLALATIVQIAHAAPVTLYVEDPAGNPFRLVHVENAGWKYIDGWKSPDRAAPSLFRKTSLSSTGAAPAAKDVVSNDEPLTVFIDGPSGFTYVWNRDSGWKFVGKLAGGRP